MSRRLVEVLEEFASASGDPADEHFDGAQVYTRVEPGFDNRDLGHRSKLARRAESKKRWARMRLDTAHVAAGRKRASAWVAALTPAQKAARRKRRAEWARKARAKKRAIRNARIP